MQNISQQIVDSFLKSLDFLVSNDIHINQTCLVIQLISQNYDDFEFEIKEDEAEKEDQSTNEGEGDDDEDDYKYDFHQAFLCSSYLMKKLAEKGELIINHLPSGEYWWGRGCCGQSVKLDYVIREIAADMVHFPISQEQKRELVTNIVKYQ